MVGPWLFWLGPMISRALSVLLYLLAWHCYFAFSFLALR